ncbi:MAG: FAD-dependent oxidoreductase [Myxococcota bacterium]|nr:3-oxosteroid 1-dehydrogenase [Spirochaeta sp.]RPG03727.1 MAG: FAD-dependent oxidoreductase [Proteobacteria bacterium TMED72]
MSTEPKSGFDHIVDVLVVGTGNGGLTGALAAASGEGESVLVIEKQDCLGGTSAASGGGVWIPNNRYARAAGVEDSMEEAREYLRATIPEDEFQPELVDAFLEQGPKMVDFLHENSQVRYESLPSYPDYFNEAPGMRPGHRSMEPSPIPMSELGDQAALLHEPNPATLLFGRLAFQQEELQLFVTQTKGWISTLSRELIAYVLDLSWRFRFKRARRLTMGAAGVARLILSLNQAGIPIWRQTRLLELIVDSGRVVGAQVEKDGRVLRIGTRRGVLLASGGFERNPTMREKYLPAPTDVAWTAGSPGNHGEGIEAASRAGAGIKFMEKAWWCTTLTVPGESAPRLSIFEKSMPGNYTVNSSGVRVANESQNYQIFMRELHEKHAAGEDCCPVYMIFDATHRRKYPVGPLMPGKFLPDVFVTRSWFSSGFVTRARSLKELAEKLEIDPAQLEETAKRVSGFSQTGKDLDFGRGDSLYDQFYGDPEVAPNPCLSPLEKAPFYALRIDPGDFGTCGGLMIDTHARVLDEHENPIPGLYATGNCTAGLLTTYPGPGATLGPAMTFGYIAGQDMLERDSVDLGTPLVKSDLA